MRFLKFLKLLIVFFAVQYAIQAQELDPFHSATHVVKGYAISNKGLMAESLIPITEIYFVITKIYKNTLNDIKCLDTVKILEYGAFINDKLLIAGDKNLVLFRPNNEKIVCLMKYYNYFKIVDKFSGKSIGHIANEKVYEYDPLINNESQNMVLGNHYKKLNNLWITKNSNNLEYNVKAINRNDNGIPLKNYETNLNKKIIKSMENCVSKSDKITFATLVNLINIDQYSYKAIFNIRKIFKGDDNLSNKKIEIIIPNDGRYRPKLNDEGILLLDDKMNIQNSCYYFLKSSKGILMENKIKIDSFINDVINYKKQGDNND